MERDIYRKHAFALLHLIESVTEAEKACKLPEDIDLAVLFQIASKHQLTALTAAGLSKCGIFDEDFREAGAKAKRRSVLYDVLFKKLEAEFVENRVTYMPLKGMLLKNTKSNNSDA